MGELVEETNQCSGREKADDRSLRRLISPNHPSSPGSLKCFHGGDETHFPLVGGRVREPSVYYPHSERIRIGSVVSRHGLEPLRFFHFLRQHLLNIECRFLGARSYGRGKTVLVW